MARALALAPAADNPAGRALHWRLIDVRHHAHEFTGQRAEQLADIQALAALAEALDDDARRADAALRRSRHATSRGDWPAGEAAALDAMALATRAGDDTLRLHATLRVARVRARLGAPTLGQALAQQGLEEAQALGLRSMEARFLNVLMLIAEQMDDPVRCLALTQQALAIERDLGSLPGEAVELGNLGNSWLNLGELERAREALEQGLRLLRSLGDRSGELPPLCNLSTEALWRGDDARTLALAQGALDIALAVEAREWHVYALLCLGEANLALGRWAEAAQAFARARTLAQSIASAERHGAAAGQLRAALAQGDTEGALAIAEALLAELSGAGSLAGTMWPRQVEFSCHRVLARAGDARAAAWLQRAHEGLQAQAATIADAALRHSFLTRIPHHHAIRLACAAQSAPG